MTSMMYIHVYKSVIDKHAPLKFNKVRAKQVPFITKELSKCVMIRSKITPPPPRPPACLKLVRIMLETSIQIWHVSTHTYVV